MKITSLCIIITELKKKHLYHFSPFVLLLLLKNKYVYDEKCKMPKPFILELYFLFVSISWEMLEGYNRLELLIPEKVKPHSHTQLFMYVKYFLVHIRKFGKWPHPTHKLIFQFRMYDDDDQNF